MLTWREHNPECLFEHAILLQHHTCTASSKTGAASWLSIRQRSSRTCCPLLSEELASDLKLHSLRPQGAQVLGQSCCSRRSCQDRPPRAAGRKACSRASGLRMRSFCPHSAEVQRPDLLLGGCGAARADGAVARKDVRGALPQPLALGRRQPHWGQQLQPGRVLTHEIQQRARLQADSRSHKPGWKQDRTPTPLQAVALSPRQALGPRG